MLFLLIFLLCENTHTHTARRSDVLLFFFTFWEQGAEQCVYSRPMGMALFFVSSRRASSARIKKKNAVPIKGLPACRQPLRSSQQEYNPIKSQRVEKEVNYDDDHVKLHSQETVETLYAKPITGFSLVDCSLPPQFLFLIHKLWNAQFIVME